MTISRNAILGLATRRDFLKTSLAASTLAMVAPYAPAFAQTPVTGGTLRVAFPDAPRSLDPQAANSYPELQCSKLIFDNLTMLDEQAQPIPAMATSWTPEAGAKEWVFELREGIKFHHGRDFTSADVVATIERAMNPALSLLAKGYYGPVESVVAEGPLKIRIILTQPFAELPVQMAANLARILPADRLDTMATNPVGSGPFKFVEVQPGSSVSFARNENWWNKGKPYLDAIKFVVIREQIAQQAALRSGDVDLITRISMEGGLTLRNVKGIKLHSQTTGDHHAMITQANMAPFDNPKVREAFKYILDREPLVTSALFGQGAVGNDMPMAPGSVYLPDVPQRTQDLARAKQLLDESGVGPIELDLYASSERPPAPKLAIAFAEAASRIGVKINVKDIPYTEYSANVARKKPFYISQWTGNATLYEMLYMKYHSSGSYNYSKLEQGPGLDALIEKMVSEPDFEARKELAQKAAAELRDTSERIIPYFLNYLGATSDKVQGFVVPQFGTLDLTGIWLAA